MSTLRWPLGFALVLLLGGCGGIDSDKGESDGPKVVASFYPLAYVAEELGTYDLVLENLTPPGAEPHDLELTSGQIRSLAEADLVVYLGQGFQPSVEEALAELDTAPLDALDSQDDLGSSGGEGGSPPDPHVWLDPTRLAAVADLVANRLVELDPEDAKEIRSNLGELSSRLTDLDREFREGLDRCERTTIVTSHEAFGHLAGAYGLEEIGVAGIDPEAEPSPGRLAEVAEFVRRNGVTTIFFESLVSPRTAETLAQEVGIETSLLDPLEGPPADGDYFSAMRSNLEALRQGLGCK